MRFRTKNSNVQCTEDTSVLISRISLIIRKYLSVLSLMRLIRHNPPPLVLTIEICPTFHGSVDSLCIAYVYFLSFVTFKNK